MDQEETREIQEEKTNVPKDGKKGMNLYTLIVLSVAAVLIFAWMMFGDGGPSGKNGADGCGVNFQSAWGQSPAAVWVDLPNYSQTRAVATFDFTYPEHPLEGFDNESFKGYSRQVFEVAYSDDAGKEGIRFSKAYTCNGFEVYEPEDGVFRSIQIMDVDGIDVKEYGDGEKVSLLFFVKGDYSYTILCPDNPMPREEAEVFVSQLD